MNKEIEELRTREFLKLVTVRGSYDGAAAYSVERLKRNHELMVSKENKTNNL